MCYGLRCRRDKYKSLNWRHQWTKRPLQRFFVEWQLLSIWSCQTEWRGSGQRAKVSSFFLRRRKIRTSLNKHADLDVYWQLKVGSVSESLINSRKGLPAVLVCRGAQRELSKTMTRHWDELREQLESRLDSEGRIRASTVIWLQCEEIWQDDAADYHDSYLSYGTVWCCISVRH